MPEARFGQIEAKAGPAMMPARKERETMAKLTMREARAAVRAVGLRLESTGWDDYRVFHIDDRNNEDRGYFTPDLEDAVDTAKAMAAERATQNAARSVKA